MKKKTSLLLVFLLLLSTAGGLRAQDPYRDASTGTVGLRLDGGTSWAFGSSFENIGANQVNLLQPYAGAGLLINIKPWVRIGADYSYTRMIREQLFTSLQPETGNVYRDFKTRFHGASLTGEFNLVELLGRGTGPGRVGLWLGTGLGVLFSQGNTWNVSVSNEISADKQTIRIGGHNEPLGYNAPFIPVTLSLEYAFLPQVALSIGGGYRFLPGKTDLAPRHQAYAKAGLVFNLTGKRYRAKQSRPAVDPGYIAPIHDTVYVEKIVEKVVEKRVEVPVSATVSDDMLPFVTFERGYSRLDEQVNASALSTLVSVLKANPSVRFDILGWTDHTGTDEINAPLSTRRAEALRDYLVGQGIDASRIVTVVGRGKSLLTGEEAFSVIARKAEAVIVK
jgi:Outer membrane protein and related peptidoglycan-associated (lipo)proteins